MSLYQHSRIKIKNISHHLFIHRMVIMYWEAETLNIYVCMILDLEFCCVSFILHKIYHWMVWY